MSITSHCNCPSNGKPERPRRSGRGAAVAAVAIILLVLTTASATALAATTASEGVDRQFQQAVTEAAARVAPSIVQIETVGGLKKVEGQLIGTGPTTGLIVEPDGYVISSAFNFASRPASILVRLPDGRRKSARLIAADHARMLVLLKIDVEEPLRVGEIGSREQLRVGQWVIALGRTFDGEQPNLAVGILSALNRVGGKAIQTDAAVSPNNYGGPLIDLHGRILGVLVPLSPQGAGQTAGMEWYDSGIGFAIPIEDIQKALPRLKRGEDLHPGLAGVTLKDGNVYTNRPIIAACLPKSPAAEAGLRADDEIVAINGRPVDRAIEVKDELGRCYAGDRATITVVRNGQRLTGEMQLAAKLEPFQHGFLGILPMRNDDRKGATVRYVYPNSPTSAAGIAVGDVVASLDGRPVKDRFDLIERIGLLMPGDAVQLGVVRDGVERTLSVSLAELPDGLPPDELPPCKPATTEQARDNGNAANGRPELQPLKIPEFANEAWAYVPEPQRAGAPGGVLVWLHAPGGFDRRELLAKWKGVCDRYGLILLAPKSLNPARWTPDEAEFIDRLLNQLDSTYRLDRSRIVACGHKGGGAMAFLTAFRNRAMFRAVAAVESIPMGKLPQNEPTQRLAIYMASADQSHIAALMERAAALLKKMKFPVTVKNLGRTPRRLDKSDREQLARWIDMLDRI